MNTHLYPALQMTELMSRLGVRASHSSSSSAVAALCVVASISNLAELEHAHGADVASRVRHVVYQRARQICMFEPGIVSMSGEHMLFVFDAQPEPELRGAACTPWPTILLERILSELGGRAVETSGGPVFAVISAVTAPWTEEPFDIAAVASTAMPPQMGSRLWRERYLADMDAALTLFTSLDEEQLRLEWEPVRDAGRTDHTLYYEGLLCRSVEGAAEHVGGLVPALERLGLVRRLDQWVVETVIDTLRANREVVLGCNISAQSARLDAWWVFIVAILSEERDIASRLVIEITETSAFEDMGAAREFVRSLQFLGCRVALDDVGAGHSTLGALVDLGVDIAKIDHAYVRKTGGDAVASERLGKLVGLAKTCAKEVVVEGIESESDADLSSRSGASGLQGYLFSSVPVRLNPPAAWGGTQP